MKNVPGLAVISWGGVLQKSNFFFFLGCKEPIWLAHHPKKRKKLKLWRLPKIEDSIARWSYPCCKQQQQQLLHVRTSHPSYSHRCRKVSIDSTDDWQCERGSSFPSRWQQLGGIAATERATNCASHETFFPIGNFKLFFHGTKIGACLGLLISKVSDRNSNFFSRYKNRCLLGFVDWQVSDRNSNIFHGTKIGACLGLLYVWMKFRWFFRSCWVLKNWNRKAKEPEWDRARGINGLKNRSEKCEGPGGRGRQVQEPEWEMQRTGRGGSTG
jgi:hypothetical protein